MLKIKNKENNQTWYNLNKIEEVFNGLIFENIEKIILSSKIKKMCKKHNINKLFLQMYLHIQKKVIDEINQKNNKKIINADIYFSKSILLGRIFELNLEFVQNVNKEFYHSANALTRQMIELYHVSALLNCDRSYCKTILKKDENKFPRFKTIRDTLKNKNYWPNIKNMTKDQFFDLFEEDYKDHSSIFHPTENSFVNNLWIYDDHKCKLISSKEYDKNIPNGTTIFLFPKKTPFHPTFLKKMINVFYTYASFTLRELKKLNYE